MKKNKIFIACDSTNILKIKTIIQKTQNSKIKFGYKFGLEFLNSKNGRRFISKQKKEIITPGIRFNSKLNDQKRVLTPKQAYRNGSDWLVIGRPLTKGNIEKNIQLLIDHLK